MPKPSLRTWPKWTKPRDYDAMRHDAVGYVDLFGNETSEPPWDAFHWSPNGKTLVEELAALRAWMSKRDRNPWHGWRPPSEHGEWSRAFWPKGKGTNYAA